MPDTRANKQEVVAQSVAGGATQALNVDCGYRDNLTVQVQGAGAAAGDWTLLVVPFQGDGATLQAGPLPALRTAALAFAGGKVNGWAQYDVQGFDRVQVQIKNTTGGALVLDRATATLGPLEG